MARVLVTGGTGTLGRHLVAQLALRGHDVVGLSRREPARQIRGTRWIQGDVRDRSRLEEAAVSADTIIHAATSPTWHARRIEIEGTHNAVAAARAHGAHLIYVSIVGVDQHRFPYYKAKWQAEQLVESSGIAWTIQRATQFFDLIDQFLGYGLFIRTRNLHFQPVSALDVAERLADLVVDGPSGRIDDAGGPEVISLRDLATTRREITRRRALLLPLPAIGVLRDFDSGRHLCPDHRFGQLTWDDWLRSSVV